MSTISVVPSGASPCALLKEISPKNSDLDGYSLSKYISELYVQCAKNLGLPCVIFRPGMIGPHSHYNLLNPSDFVQRYICGIIKLGCAPLLKEHHKIDIVPIDVVVQQVVDAAMDEKSFGKIFTVEKIFLSFEDMHQQIRSMGYSLSILTNYNEWVHLVEEDHTNPLYTLLPLLLDDTLFKGDKEGMSGRGVLQYYDLTKNVEYLIERKLVPPPPKQ